MSLLFRSVASMLIIVASMAPAASFGGMGAQEIMERNFYVTKVRGLRTDGTMLLKSERGESRTRKSTTFTKLQGNGIDSNILVTFDAPPDIKGTAFLQLEHSNADDDLWIYLPGLGKVRRLVSSNKRDSFVGSDFSYGDILLPWPDLYSHSLLRSELLDGQDCFVVASIPKNEATKNNSGYSKKVSWIRKDNFLEAKVDYFDTYGEFLKTQMIAKPKQVEANPPRWLALQREMVNHQSGHRTIISVDKIEAMPNIEEKNFSPRTLDRQ